MSPRPQIRVKRIYDAPSADDGYRVLVDRVWPRGFPRERAALDDWMKEVAPSTELRRWFGHDPERFHEFASRYRAELEKQGEAVEGLRARARRGPVTLLYGARDPDHNNAVVLAHVVRGR